MTRHKNRQKGSVLTLVMSGIAMTAVLGITTFSLMSGPLSTIMSVNKKTIVQSQVQAIARIALMEAQNATNFGDCDSDGIVELRAGRDASADGITTPVEYVPTALGTPTRDPWGNDYLYCTWDMGAVSANASCGAGAQRADGADDPFRAADDANAATKLATSQTLIAVFSRGADGTANSTCADWTNDTTAVFTCAGDDICKKYTYSEAAKQIGGVWNLKEGAPTTITTSKNLEIGDDISINAASGDAAFTTLETSTGKILATGGLKLPLETNATVDTLCGISYEGLLRFNEALAAVEVCDGTDWVEIEGGGGGGGGAASEWTEASAGNIYYNDGGVMVGTQSITASDNLKLVSTDGAGAISVVQTVQGQASGTGSYSLSFSTLPTVGNTIIISVAGQGASVNFGITASNVSDNHGGTYTQAAASPVVTPRQRSYILYRSNITGPITAPFTVTFNPDSNDEQVSWGIMEVSGLATASALDQTGTASSTNKASTTVSTSAPTTQVNDLGIAVITGTAVRTQVYDSVTSGWDIKMVEQTSTSSGVAWLTAAKILNAAATASVTVAHALDATATGNESAAIATFKGATATISTPTVKNLELMSNDNASDAAHLDFFHAEGTLASPQDIETDDNTGYMSFYGYNGGWKKGFQLTNEVNASGNGDTKIALGGYGNALETAMWFGDGGASITLGPTKGGGTINVSGSDPDIRIDTYTETAANASNIEIKKGTGSMGSPAGLASGHMLGGITWQGEDGNGYSSAAAMNVLVNGTVDATRLDTDVVFQTSPAGNASATVINAEALRITSAGNIGINTPAPLDTMHVNGILRITNTTNNDTFTWDGDNEYFMYFVPSTATMRMGFDDAGDATAPGLNSFSIGENAYTSTANFLCICYNMSAGGENSIVFDAANEVGANSLLMDASYADGSEPWTTDNDIMKADYSVVMDVSEYIVNASAHHSTALGTGDFVINGSYSYVFGSSVTVNDADPYGPDHIFAINLAYNTPTTYRQAHTMAIMNGKVTVGGFLNPGAYSLYVIGQAGNNNNPAGTWTAPSDARLKDIKGPYKKGMQDIAQLYPMRFKYKEGNPDGIDSSEEHTGFIAQAVQTVFPETVHTRPDGYLDFNMSAINVAKVNAIKELHAEQAILLAEQAKLAAEQKQLQEEYAALRTKADRLMNVAGIPNLHNMWLAIALPMAGFMAFGLGLGLKRRK